MTLFRTTCRAGWGGLALAPRPLIRFFTHTQKKRQNHKLKNYEKAIKSYQAAQKIYPSMKSAEIMIPQLQELIKEEAI